MEQNIDDYHGDDKDETDDKLKAGSAHSENTESDDNQAILSNAQITRCKDCKNWLPSDATCATTRR